MTRREANRAFMQGACRAACGRAEARAAAVASEAFVRGPVPASVASASHGASRWAGVGRGLAPSRLVLVRGGPGLRVCRSCPGHVQDTSMTGTCSRRALTTRLQVMSRTRPGHVHDRYLFAAGLDYASALRDFAALSGVRRPPSSPSFLSPSLPLALRGRTRTRPRGACRRSAANPPALRVRRLVLAVVAVGGLGGARGAAAREREMWGVWGGVGRCGEVWGGVGGCGGV